MSDDPTPPVNPPAAPEAPPAPDPGQTFTQADLDKIVEQRLSRERKKFADYDDVKAKAARLDTLEQASATDLEKAVRAARDEERASVARDFGTQLARGVMEAHLGQTMKPADVEALIDDLNLAKYVADDGTVDRDAIAKTVARLAPRGSVDLGQGGRGEPAGPSQLTRSDMRRMTPQQIEEARVAGRFNDLLGIKQ